MSVPFADDLRNQIHECAPDHSQHIISVGEVRGAARLIDELYEALAEMVAARNAYLEADCDSRAESIAAGRLDAAQEVAERLLAKARGEQA